VSAGASTDLRSSTRRTAPLRLRRIAGRIVPGRRMTPTFIIGGVKRGGTTSLDQYLRRHPDVIASVVTKGSRYFDVNHARGPAWYRSHFAFERTARRHERATGRAAITGESSPYTIFHPLSAARLAAMHPDIRVIVMLRDPTQRAWSHYQYETKRGFEPLPIHEALDAETDRLAGEVERIVADPTYVSFAHRHWSYLARGRYAEQLDRLWSTFPPEQILVLRSEDLFAAPGPQFRRVTDFLGLRPFELDSYDAWKATPYAPIPDDVRHRLTSYYAPLDAGLATRLGPAFGWDRVGEDPAGR
jgi:Sulfotransferase domain